MKPLRILSASEQVAAYLRNELIEGRWKEEMPGEGRLAERLGVGRDTVKAAVKLLEAEKLVEAQGHGRRRRIAPPEQRPVPRNLRARILPYESLDSISPQDVELLVQLKEAGFNAEFARANMLDLNMDVARIARVVDKTPADAWVILSGSSEILEWFTRQPVPVLAVAGRFSGLPIAAVCARYAPALTQTARRLVELGHRRIVMFVRKERRQPHPAVAEQAFLDELNRLGIQTGTYHLPEWDEHPEGLRRCIDTLFRFTPPSAMVFGETSLFVAAREHLARRGIHAPEGVSLISLQADPAFSLCEPTISHFHSDNRLISRRVLRWAKNIASGKEDRRQMLFDAEFVEGGTIGPARG